LVGKFVVQESTVLVVFSSLSMQLTLEGAMEYRTRRIWLYLLGSWQCKTEASILTDQVLVLE
jgi:hypothetical protein